MKKLQNVRYAGTAETPPGMKSIINAGQDHSVVEYPHVSSSHHCHAVLEQDMFQEELRKRLTTQEETCLVDYQENNLLELHQSDSSHVVEKSHVMEPEQDPPLSVVDNHINDLLPEDFSLFLEKEQFPFCQIIVIWTQNNLISCFPWSLRYLILLFSWTLKDLIILFPWSWKRLIILFPCSQKYHSILFLQRLKYLIILFLQSQINYQEDIGQSNA
jgi:hypothetical protein